jgi:hypothetical protein
MVSGRGSCTTEYIILDDFMAIYPGILEVAHFLYLGQICQKPWEEALYLRYCGIPWVEVIE